MKRTTAYRIRFVKSEDEIRRVIHITEAWFVPPMQDVDLLINDLTGHFPEYRNTMVIAKKGDRLAGAALGFGGKLAIIAVFPDDRRVGLARRLLQTFEVGAMHHGVTMVYLGAREEAKGFYRRVGYGGKTAMHKGLPLPGKSLDWRLKKIDAVMGNLEVGQEIEFNEADKVPPLYVTF